VPPHRSTCATVDCDVLVLGAGLAGMRAALAAKQADARLRVTLVSPRARSAGSSFANRNNALGLQVPREDEADAFVAEVLRLAAPGLAFEPLVRALAEDAQARLADLLDLGLNFRREPVTEGGSLKRFPGCFSTAPRAVIFDGLRAAHAAFLARVRASGVELLYGHEALGLTRETGGGRVCGARLQTLRGDASLTVRAKTVIAALGGPAPLFARRICGPGGTGLAYGLLASVGTRLVNAPFLQFFWVEAQTLGFVNPGELLWQEGLAGLASQRLTHCPTAFGLSDFALDLSLLSRRSAQGIALAEHPSRGALSLVLAAHAGNGGAFIDAAGRTSVPGLYACGECASGMHGANRLGGAMVLSALVFGARSGAAAALEASGRRESSGSRTPKTSDARAAERDGFLPGLRRGMQRHALPGAGTAAQTGRGRFVEGLRDTAKRADAADRERLLALSALLVLGEPPG